MAKNQWRRYQPPGEQRRDEDGQRVVPVKPKPKPTPRKTKPTPKRPSASSTARKQSGSGKDSTGSAAKIVIGVMIALVIVVIAIVIVAVNNGDDDYDPGDVGLETLDVAFIQRGLDNALEFRPEGQPFSVELDEYYLTVSYYDPNTEKVHEVETGTYKDDGYDVRVGENYYDDFRPRPFDLAEVQGDGIVAAVETALEQSDNPWSWRAEVAVDRETGELTIEADVSADDNVTVVAEPDGTVIDTTSG